MECLVVDIGPSAYREAWDLQRAVWNARVEGSVPDVLMLTEHRHVYTLGKGADENHLLATKEELRQKGVEVFEIDRGGDVTYHGPGQIVGYPIVDLNDHYRDVHRYLRDLEEVVIRTLLSLGVEGNRIEGLTGVWVDGRKIAAIGVKVSRWVTMHGFALNVNTDLSYFNGIVPCGIFHKGVTSLQQVLARDVDMERVKVELSKRFGETFGLTMKYLTRAEFNVHSEAKKELEQQER